MQSIAINGEQTSKLWISHEQLMQGGTIHFVMGDKPRTDVHYTQNDLPPSLSNEMTG